MKERRIATEKNLRWQWKYNRAAFITWLLLRLFVLVALVHSAVKGDYENVFICILVLFLFLLPSILQKGWEYRFQAAFRLSF